MNSLAFSSQRTGQPRWAQLTEKAMNSVSVARLSQAELFDVTPAQGSGDASTNTTLTVSPTLNELSFPTLRHSRGVSRKSGATTNATPGNEMAAPPTRPIPTLI